LGAYGRQAPIFGVADAFIALQLGPQERAKLEDYRIKYLLVDKRLSTALPVSGFYFGYGETHDSNYTSPLSLSALQKFDGITDVNRIFDSGNIVIYDVGALSRAP
jgi:hypothetical protein